MEVEAVQYEPIIGRETMRQRYLNILKLIITRRKGIVLLATYALKSMKN